MVPALPSTGIATVGVWEHSWERRTAPERTRRVTREVRTMPICGEITPDRTRAH